MRVTNRLRFPLVCLLVTGLIAGLAAACDGEEEETATATPIAATLTPAAAATPTVVAVPPQPGDFADYPAAIADYLAAAGGSPSCLAELLAVWDMPTAVPEWAEEYGAVDCAAGDLDGDGDDEYLVRLTNPVATDASTGPVNMAEVFIFDRRTSGYEVAFQSGLGWVQPVILGIRDFNGDGKVEASFTATTFAVTYWTDVYILAWDGQQYADLLHDDFRWIGGPDETVGHGVPSARDIHFVDAEGDGVEELVAEGQFSLGGAGDVSLTYVWDGISYVMAETEYEPSEPSVDVREVDFSEVLGTTGCCAEFAKYADLTGDGQEEAILPLFPAATGPINGFDGLWVYGYVDGELQALLAVETAIWGSQVEDSRLVVEYPVYGPDDLMSEPSQLNYEYYEWDGSELVLVGEETIDNPYLP